MSWGTGGDAKASAMPDISTLDLSNNESAKNHETSTNPAPTVDPQAFGWGEKQSYDYDKYNASSKEQFAKGVETGEWEGNAAIYEWNDEFGEVGPRFEELEKQLFGGDNRSRSGIRFDNIATISVTQEGPVQIQPVRSFDAAGLHPVMLENVKLAGYNVPTPVQSYTLPAIKEGYDIIACAQTGSGKTAAFMIPIMSKLMGKAKKLAAPRPNPVTFVPGQTPPVRAEPLVLIVCPSRELATQIFTEARRFCYRTMLRPVCVYGGGPIGDQINLLAKGCDILIGTPGRLVDFIGRPHILTLKRLKYMVIDEADEMLQADWEQELKVIMSGGDQEEGNIKYLMFSATFPKIARELAAAHLSNDHVRIHVGRAGSSHLNITQTIVWVEAAMKRQAVKDLLMSSPPARTIIFVNSKRAADEVDDWLFNEGFPCVSIHSDRTQREREDCIRAFRAGKCPILIATGVSARGLDVANVMHVINYDMPSTRFGGIEEYTHRIGRTGRIGNKGLSTSFYNDRDEELGSDLVKVLLETKQIVPDFLEQYTPEGWNDIKDEAERVKLLKFDADSDDEDDGGAAWGEVLSPAAGGDSGWGEPTKSPLVTPKRIVVPKVREASKGDDAWGSGGGWGEPAKAAPVTPKGNDSWGGGGTW